MRRLRSTVARGVVVSTVIVVAVTGCSGGTAPAPGGSRTSTPSPTPSSSAAALDHRSVDRALAALEREYDATVGVVATDTVTGETVAYNGDRRFGYASTIKVFAAAQFLRSVHADARNEVVHWTAADVTAAGYSP